MTKTKMQNTTTSKKTPKKWDVWLASVVFEDQPNVSKKRPVLVIDTYARTSYIVVLKMTSHAIRKDFDGEYQIQELAGTGLLKPTVVRCHKIINMTTSSLIKKLGVLNIKDIWKVKEELAKLSN